MYSISEFAGLLVKQAREEKQWDQQYLADELDIDIRTLKKIEAVSYTHLTASLLIWLMAM